MSERTFNWIVAAVGALLLGYMLLAGPIMQRAQQREEEPMPTQGQAAFGTTLYRDGVAVAEIIALREVGARDAVALNLTSHDSAERFHEVIQGLRERRKFAVLGNHLPEQTGTWVEDFMDGDTLHGYTIVFPTGERHAFLGFLTQVGTRGEIGGRLYWDAVIVPVPSGEYWHCTGAPGAPGIPPPGDPDHWEQVTQAVAEAGVQEWHFGYDQIGASWSIETEDALHGTLYPNGLAEAPTLSKFRITPWEPGTTPDPPDPAVFTADIDHVAYSLYVIATQAGDTLTITAARAYLFWLGEVVGRGRVLLYDGSGNLLGASNIGEVAETGWAEFTFGTPLEVGVETAVLLSFWAERPADPYLDMNIFYDPVEEWVAPEEPEEVPEWDPDAEDYVLCNYVHYAP